MSSASSTCLVPAISIQRQLYLSTARYLSCSCYICQVPPFFRKGQLYLSSASFTCQVPALFVKRQLYLSSTSYICQEVPVLYVKCQLYLSSASYIYPLPTCQMPALSVMFLLYLLGTTFFSGKASYICQVPPIFVKCQLYLSGIASYICLPISGETALGSWRPITSLPDGKHPTSGNN